MLSVSLNNAEMGMETLPKRISAKNKITHNKDKIMNKKIFLPSLQAEREKIVGVTIIILQRYNFFGYLLI